MHIPSDYRGEPFWATALVREHPLALLVTVGEDKLHMSHVPVILVEDSLAADGGLGGARILGHMNRANPHWLGLREVSEGWLVIHGPDAYITPDLYGITPAAPTWNFAVVHLRGRVTRLDDDARLGVLVKTVDQYEDRNETAWDRSSSHSYFRELEPAVGAFAIEVEQVEAMFKMSQDKPATIRQQVIEGLSVASTGTARDVAALMRRMGLGDTA